MKTTIRQGVFETNSSSTHSLSISDNSDYQTISLNEDNNIVISGIFQFGWGYEELYDFEEKMAYYYLSNQNDEDAIDKLIEVVREETGADDVIFYIDEDISYIDHQSYDTAHNMTYEDIKNFIFNPNSYIILDNDNNYDDTFGVYGY